MAATVGSQIRAETVRIRENKRFVGRFHLATDTANNLNSCHGKEFGNRMHDGKAQMDNDDVEDLLYEVSASPALLSVILFDRFRSGSCKKLSE